MTAGAEREGRQLVRKASGAVEEDRTKQGSGSLFWEIEVETKQL